MKNKKCVSGWIAGVVLACVGYCVSVCNVQGQAPQYMIESLDLEGGRVIATGLNNLGEAVGYYFNSHSTLGFMYSNGTIIDFKTSIFGINNHPYDINDNGQIVGYMGTSPSRAFLYANGNVTMLDIYNGLNARAYAINNAGQVVGIKVCAVSYSEEVHAVAFWQGNTIDLGTLGEYYGTSEAYAINDNTNYGELSQIVGQTTSPYGDQAFLYAKETMIDIGKNICPTTFQNSSATDINNNGQIAGYCFMPDSERYLPFVYNIENGTHTLIGNGGNGNRVAVNDLGQVVGTDTNGNASIPFLWINGEEYNLYDLMPPNTGLTNIKPVAINNKGQILANADQAAVLLTPVNEK